MNVHHSLKRCYHLALLFSFIFGCFWILQTPIAQAQTPASNNALITTMKNLHQDAHSFRPVFDKAVRKSTLHHTSQERDALDMALSLNRETAALIQSFQKNPNDGRQFRRVMETAQPLDTVVHTVDLGPEVTAKWQTIRTELHQLGLVYGYPESFRYPINSANPK